MAKRYRIQHRYPCYSRGGWMPHDGYFVQVLKEGLFIDRWVDVKGFDSRKKAEELIKTLE